MARTVGLYLARLARQVVAAQVGRDGEVRVPELGQLGFPFVPELGESVHEQHQRLAALAGAGVMQPGAVGQAGELQVPDHGGGGHGGLHVRGSSLVALACQPRSAATRPARTSGLSAKGSPGLRGPTMSSKRWRTGASACGCE
ncbi:hypothetical protein D3C72_1972360 [compost metagenome]